MKVESTRFIYAILGTFAALVIAALAISGWITKPDTVTDKEIAIAMIIITAIGIALLFVVVIGGCFKCCLRKFTFQLFYHFAVFCIANVHADWLINELNATN